MKLNFSFSISRKRLKQIILCFVIVFAIHPKRFAVNYEYVVNEDIINHLVPSYKSEANSCPILPRLAIRETPPVKIVNYDAYQFALNSNINPGGWWKPSLCKSVHDIAVIIPYRNRSSQLNAFLYHIHPFLQKQLLNYRIFVVEQTFKKPFNRGLLLNVGFIEAMKIHSYHCFIFHDVDLLPAVERNIYACTDKPRHLCPAINTWRFKLKYSKAFGGAIAILQNQFSQINGFSNMYFGWGGEDDDFMERLLHNNLGYYRFSPEISRYYMLHHKPEEGNPIRMKILKEAETRLREDGINSLNYTQLQFNEKKLYTHVLVDV